MRREAVEYIAYLHKDGKSDFGVSFPIFPAALRRAGRWKRRAVWLLRRSPSIFRA